MQSESEILERLSTETRPAKEHIDDILTELEYTVQHEVIRIRLGITSTMNDDEMNKKVVEEWLGNETRKKYREMITLPEIRQEVQRLFNSDANLEEIARYLIHELERIIKEQNIAA